jgi:hypothetical protein
VTLLAGCHCETNVNSPVSRTKDFGWKCDFGIKSKKTLDESVKIRVCQLKFPMELSWQIFSRNCIWLKIYCSRDRAVAAKNAKCRELKYCFWNTHQPVYTCALQMWYWTLVWKSGHRVRLQNKWLWVQIPPGVALIICNAGARNLKRIVVIVIIWTKWKKEKCLFSKRTKNWESWYCRCWFPT